MHYIKFLTDLSMEDLPTVGGKNASLGQMIQQLQQAGSSIRIPLGYAVTVEGYWDHLEQNNLMPQMKKIIAALEVSTAIPQIQKVGKAIRDLIYSAPLPTDLAAEIITGYEQLSAHYNVNDLDVAVRSSATAEDLPHASFAGQQETYLNIRGKQELLEAVKKCMASLFTDRAIVYRIEQGFDHFQVGISVGIQKMVRADKASSGVSFSLDTDTGFKNVVVITASYGLGENIVKGVVNPDEFHVHKQTLEQGYRPIIKKLLGSKELKLVYTEDKPYPLENVPVSFEEQHAFSLDDEDILELARQTVVIEQHYSSLKKTWTPMDIEWAKDGIDGHLYIVQARPETIHSQKMWTDLLIRYELKELPPSTKIITTGLSIGQKIATGKARILRSIHEYSSFHEGDILVTPMTDPDWVPLMKKASAIITDKGGRTCHAAIVSRELGIPAIIGTTDATTLIRDGNDITVDTSQGSTGYIYEGILEYEVIKTAIGTLPEPRVPVMLNIADPERSYKLQFLPVSGVGLARLEFIITSSIKVHPMAICEPEKISDPRVKQLIEQMSMPFNHDPRTFFVDTLAMGIGRIAASFYPRPVVVRLSDFKSNEYRNLLAGEDFEPIEENPMLGFRGAARYCDPAYAPAFSLECEAVKKAYNDMGMTNIKLLVPFVRNLHEAGCTLATLQEHGISRKDGLEILMMCEIPSNILLLEEFSKSFDGFSIGSNDLTQFILAVDRDSEKLATMFNEQDLAVKKALIMAVDEAKKVRKPIGICGQAPSDFPEITDMLIEHGISSISLNPDSVIPFLTKEPPKKS